MIEQQRRKRENTQFFLPSSVQYLPTLGERAAACSTIMMSNFTKTSKGLHEPVFKLNSTQSPESLLVIKRLNPNSVSPRWINPNHSVCCQENSLQTLVLMLASKLLFSGYLHLSLKVSSDTRFIFIVKAFQKKLEQI